MVLTSNYLKSRHHHSASFSSAAQRLVATPARRTTPLTLAYLVRT